MSHTEREIVPDGGTNERKRVLSLKFLASVWNTKYAIISRGVESAVGMYSSGRSDREGGAVHVITLWQIVAILYSILCSTGNQCKSTIRLWKEHSITIGPVMLLYFSSLFNNNDNVNNNGLFMVPHLVRAQSATKT